MRWPPALVTAGVASTVLVHSRRPVESIALAIDTADLAVTQHIPIRIDAVEHSRELLDATLLIVVSGRGSPTPPRTGEVGWCPTRRRRVHLTASMYRLGALHD
ncbi:MAG: hypothetical protein M3332_08350, partial [Actinomycetota bacterium]|nr:hypothetical protein [Actinomycetota bacterium]